MVALFIATSYWLFTLALAISASAIGLVTTINYSKTYKKKFIQARKMRYSNSVLYKLFLLFESASQAEMNTKIMSKIIIIPVVLIIIAIVIEYLLIGQIEAGDSKLGIVFGGVSILTFAAWYSDPLTSLLFLLMTILYFFYITVFVRRTSLVFIENKLNRVSLFLLSSLLISTQPLFLHYIVSLVVTDYKTLSIFMYCSFVNSAANRFSGQRTLISGMPDEAEGVLESFAALVTVVYVLGYAGALVLQLRYMLFMGFVLIERNMINIENDLKSIEKDFKGYSTRIIVRAFVLSMLSLCILMCALYFAIFIIVRNMCTAIV
jgi:hypothetical protein